MQPWLPWGYPPTSLPRPSPKAGRVETAVAQLLGHLRPDLQTEVAVVVVEEETAAGEAAEEAGEGLLLIMEGIRQPLSPLLGQHSRIEADIKHTGETMQEGVEIATHLPSMKAL